MVREQQQAEAQEKAKQEFVAALGQGIGMVKHDRKGHSRLRELYSPDEGQSFSWRHPQPQPGKEKGPGAGAGAAHHQRGASGVGAGAGVFERGRAVYAFHEILEVCVCCFCFGWVDAGLVLWWLFVCDLLIHVPT